MEHETTIQEADMGFFHNTKRDEMRDDYYTQGVTQGIAWKTKPNMTGSANGYVHLPKNHPWRDLKDWQIPANVYGGITYGPDRDGWIGFDTCHPGMETMPLSDVQNDTRRLAQQVAAAV